MYWPAWIGMALGIVLVVGGNLGKPPVIMELGPFVPTPVPTMKPAAKKRMVTTITVQNNTEGESVVSFEVTDFTTDRDGKQQTIASKRYSLAEEEAPVRSLRAKIVSEVRQIERDMLEYAERTGPPKARPPIGAGGGAGGGGGRY